MKLQLKRFLFTDKSIIGRLFINGVFTCYILENPYLNNEKYISCIPIGTYDYVIRDGVKAGSKYKYFHPHIINVPNRSLILIHPGNYPKDTLGCLLPGDSYQKDVVWSSRKAFDRIMDEIQMTSGTIIITNEE